MHNWSYVRWLARQLHVQAEASTDHSLRGQELVEAAAKANTLSLVRLPSDDPLLGGARSMLDAALGVIAIDDDLPSEAKVFSVAHETGHKNLHGDTCRCYAHDIDETPTTAQLPYAEGAIETCNPHQRRETEANVFAAELLMPSDEVLRLFVDENNRCSQIAAHFSVS